MKIFTPKTIKSVLLILGLLAIFICSVFGYSDIPTDKLKEKYAQQPSAFVGVDGIQVHYRDEGIQENRIPLVLIHGTGASLHTFQGWAAELSKTQRVISLDLPAYGLTGPFLSRNYSTDNYVDFLKRFLDSIGVEKCILAGNSLGGGIAWNFSLTYPVMVDKLILIDATGYPSEGKSVPIAFQLAQTPILKNIFTFITPRSMVKSSIENVYADKSKVNEELIDRYFELTLREGNRQAFIDKFETNTQSDAYKNISAIYQKTLILWGDQDKLIPVQNAYKFHEDLPNDTLVILENVGHVPMEELPMESLLPVLDFLKSDSY